MGPAGGVTLDPHREWGVYPEVHKREKRGGLSGNRRGRSSALVLSSGGGVVGEFWGKPGGINILNVTKGDGVFNRRQIRRTSSVWDVLIAFCKKTRGLGFKVGTGESG